MPSFRSSSGKENPEKPALPEDRKEKSVSSRPRGPILKSSMETKPRRFKKPAPAEVYRVEGIGRKGAVRYVKIIGNAGLWRIVGIGGLQLEVPGRTVADAIKRAGRRIPFKPIVIRQLETRPK